MATDVRAVLIKLVGKNETKAAFASINKSLAGIKTGIQQMGKFTIAAGVGAGALANMGAEFSIKMAEVNTMLDDSGQTVAMFKNQILDLAKETGKAPLELAEALRQTLSAGVDAGDAMKFLARSTKAAIGGVADTVQVVDLATNAMNAFGKENLKLDRILSVSQQTVKLGKTTMTELAESMGILFQPASAIGLEFEDINAAMVTLTKGGVKTVNAVTQLKAIMSGVLKPTSEVSDAAKRLGIDFSAAGLKSKGLIGFMKDIQDKTKGNKEEIATLLPNVRAMGAAFTLTGEQANEAKVILDALRSSVNEDGKAFEKVAGSAGFKFKKSLNEIRTAAVEMGGELLPIINNIVKDTITWTSKNEVLTKSVISLTASLVLLKTTGIGAILVGIGKLSMVAIPLFIAKIGSLIMATQTLAATFGFLATIKGIAIAAASGIAILLAKVVAVAAVFYGLGRAISYAFEKLTPEFFNSVANGMQKIGEFLGVFESRMSEDQLNKIAARNEERIRANRTKQINEKNEGQLNNGEPREDGRRKGLELKMAVNEALDQHTEGIREGFRSNQTQLAGAITAGGNGL